MRATGSHRKGIKGRTSAKVRMVVERLSTGVKEPMPYCRAGYLGAS
ncbi:MAG: hypothetical protein NZ992_06160 [Candidatus Korarchaeum sp.]|nr:hypothetical protein [Candidatus Korarchaeum sp.]MDW8035631.1 hypothetical protein [Candidatus Korarchaeum sp.]